MTGGQRIGEIWLTGDDSGIVNGAHTGKTLRELSLLCGTSLFGDPSRDREGTGPRQHPSGQPVFPLLVKVLFTTAKLSVQVHPPDDVAARRGSWGKTEMWHIVHAEPGARLAVGFRDKLAEKLRTQHALREAAASGVIEQMLEWTEVHAGETFFVPAGTVHAIGAGLTICEIQQNSDITYRLYDYNRPGSDGRPRTLHLDEAMEVIAWRTDGGRTEPVVLPADSGSRTLLAACPCFAAERWEATNDPRSETQPQVLRFSRNGVTRQPSSPVVWVVTQGEATFEANPASPLWPVTAVACSAGEAVIIPADALSYTVRPLAQSVLLRIYQPSWEQDIVAPLRAAGISAEQMRRVAFAMDAARHGVA